MNCQQCKSNMYPENPAMPQYNQQTHRYFRPICEGCSSFHEEEMVAQDPSKEIKSPPYVYKQQHMYNKQHSNYGVVGGHKGGVGGIEGQDKKYSLSRKAAELGGF